MELDRPETYSSLDKEEMFARLAELPQQCRDAWELAGRWELPPGYGEVGEVVVSGMGGSAIAGDLLRGIVASERSVPIVVCRDYELPAYVGPRTLVVASSYSGDTEETLSAFEQALAEGAKVVALTTGGRLAALAEARGIPCLRFSYRAQPRAALGYSLVLLLGLLVRLGLARDHAAALEEAGTVTAQLARELGPQVPEARNPAKALARRLFGRLPVVYGGGVLAEVARRWKGQLNENAKSWAFFEQLPELNHNAVLGYQLPPEVRSRALVIFLLPRRLHRRTALRYRLTQELLEKAGVEWAQVEAPGESDLAQVLSSVLQGDYVSCYLALLNGVDPSDTSTIAWLKARLAQAE